MGTVVSPSAGATRGRKAVILVAGHIFLVAGILIYVLCGETSEGDSKDLITLLITSYTTLLGSALGYISVDKVIDSTFLAFGLSSILFRCDASLSIGSGHVMRCRTLAREMERRGARIVFVCRCQAGDLISLLQQEFTVLCLPNLPLADCEGLEGRDLYGAWLGCSQETDAGQCLELLVNAEIYSADWVVVDHYGLDHNWESIVLSGLDGNTHTKLLVIDDLADRVHHADVLLDQNYYGTYTQQRYQGLVGPNCLQLLGPDYALIRPEFRMLRPASLARREILECNKLLVFLGGSDATNETGKVIDGALEASTNWEHIDVVVGQSHPEIDGLKTLIANFPSATLHIQTPYMARLMAFADIAITGGGSVTWEKCTLGLPSVVAIMADNQKDIAAAMNACGAQQTLGRAKALSSRDYADCLGRITEDRLKSMSICASKMCDGSGLSFLLIVMGIQV